jgi:hypothetical protein
MLAGYMTPGADMMDASAAGRELFSAETPMDAATAAATMAAAGGMMLLPGSVGALREGFNSTVDEMAGAYDPTVVNAFRAYHGSPHTFDRFDISKIGTGEGAQAYGHGLYFAENEGVARGYREALAPQNPFTLAERLYEIPDVPQQSLSTVWDMASAGRNHSEIYKYLDSIRPGLSDELRSSLGSMYEVQINADPSQFLDWDAPLSAQPQNVQQAMREFLDPTYGDGFFDQYAASGTGVKDVYDNFDDLSPVDFSQNLLRRGVQGTRYLDAGSRAAGDGSRNFVVFDDSIIDILRRYGIGGAAVGGGWALSPGDAQAATDAGILDQQERERQSIIDWLGSL